MVQLILTIDDLMEDRVLDGMALQYNYQLLIPDPNATEINQMIPNPETKLAFFKRIVQLFITDSVKSAEKQTLINVTTDVMGEIESLNNAITWES